MIERVISGGQTGADRAGWEAAKAAGIPTGGWMPKGFKAEDGYHPEFAEMYGAKEHASADYPPRTEANILGSGGTVLFGDPASPGSKLTLRLCNRFDRPCLTIRHSERHRHEYVARMIEHYGIVTLNVAGNRESSAPGINAWVHTYLSRAFAILAGEGRA